VRVVVPYDKPDTMPDVMPVVATAVLLLVHVPPFTASLKVTGEPTQILAGPEMAEGGGTTVSVVVAVHPVLNV